MALFVAGIQIDHETTDLTEPSQEIKDAYEMIVSSTTRHLHSWLDPHAPKQETYSVPIMQFGGQRYYARQTRNIDLMLALCWASVVDGGPT